MNIKHIIWETVEVTHENGESEIMHNCAIEYRPNDVNKDINMLSIREYTSAQGTNTGKGFVLARPTLVKLTSWGIEFDALWFGKEPHKVKVVAEF